MLQALKKKEKVKFGGWRRDEEDASWRRCKIRIELKMKIKFKTKIENLTPKLDSIL